jgi:hypothetical protein
VSPIRVGPSCDISWFVEKRQDWKRAVLVGQSIVRVGPSCDISWFVEKRQDWERAVLVGRSVVRVGPSCDLSSPVGAGLEDGSSVVERTLELTETTVVGVSWFVEKLQER